MGHKSFTADLTRPPKVFPAGRICTEDDCTKILSMYNPGEKCFEHQPLRYPRVRGKMYK